ncbi:hypothetical protein VPG91_29930, partial [Nitrospirillum amazonense]|nr:hypothetical protein [Nitrospirillum amazonense]
MSACSRGRRGTAAAGRRDTGGWGGGTGASEEAWGGVCTTTGVTSDGASTVSATGDGGGGAGGTGTTGAGWAGFDVNECSVTRAAVAGADAMRIAPGTVTTGAATRGGTGWLGVDRGRAGSGPATADGRTGVGG